MGSAFCRASANGQADDPARGGGFSRARGRGASLPIPAFVVAAGVQGAVPADFNEAPLFAGAFLGVQRRPSPPLRVRPQRVASLVKMAMIRGIIKILLQQIYVQISNGCPEGLSNSQIAHDCPQGCILNQGMPQISG